MKPTRRRAILTLLYGAGIMTLGDRSWAQGSSSPNVSVVSKGSLNINLDAFTALVVTLNGREVKFTPEEIMDALESKP